MPSQTAAPMPTLAATRTAIADRIVVDAIDAYEDAHRRHRELDVAINDDHELDKFNGLAHERLAAARAHLVRAILARHLDADWGGGRRLDLTVHPTCGVSRGGRLYQAAVIPDYANAPAGDEPCHLGEPVMQLVVADVEAIPELGKLFHDGRGSVFTVGDVQDSNQETPTPGPEPDARGHRQVEDGDADDSLPADDDPVWKPGEKPLWARKPGPGHPRTAPAGPYYNRPLPLLKATHTVCLPGDPWPVTLELIVLASPTEDEKTAGVADVPELSQGGWRCHTVGSLDIFTRLIIAD